VKEIDLVMPARSVLRHALSPLHARTAHASATIDLPAAHVGIQGALDRTSSSASRVEQEIVVGAYTAEDRARGPGILQGSNEKCCS